VWRISFSELTTLRLNWELPEKYPALFAARLRRSGKVWFTLRTLRANRFEALLKFREMRSRPVNLAAADASPEFFVIDFGKWLKFFNYVTFGDSFEPRIATEATRKWSDRAKKIKAAHHLDCLRIRTLRPRAVTMSNDRMHQQSTVSREQPAIFAGHYLE
jgi:hypothetical protein